MRIDICINGTLKYTIIDNGEYREVTHYNPKYAFPETIRTLDKTENIIQFIKNKYRKATVVLMYKKEVE